MEIRKEYLSGYPQWPSTLPGVLKCNANAVRHEHAAGVVRSIIEQYAGVALISIGVPLCPVTVACGHAARSARVRSAFDPQALKVSGAMPAGGLIAMYFTHSAHVVHLAH